MATSIDQKNFVKTALRLPPELHAAVHESAQKNGRSYNAELVERIQSSFETAEQASAEALMLEMRRTQLLLRRSQVQADASRVFFSASDDAKKERAYREANPDPREIEEAKKAEKTARLKAGHLRQEIMSIDGRLLEIEQRLRELGHTMEFLPVEDPSDHAVRVLNKPKL
ncbi:Arc family DNA-binding protein [Paracidovorax anthurii]|uniref:Arc-like DNA binding dprotein n=1 Tax=Paracidovorax anthurii TaxID=78229 RepID=A0A328ZHD9_9BURK|nr:Arc family DNA-binding protein [Paracidovorax anthurii]RAR85004.1 Arc-like DNA binding dprotein [Paracidovorax anthurii]